MIIGIGNDIVAIERIEKMLKRYGERFENRCFTPTERAKAHKSKTGKAAVYAKRFAAKEACAKALGTGFIEDIYLRDIGVEEDSSGRPLLKLTNGAKYRLDSLIPRDSQPILHLSLSDEPPLAQAFVIIEARPLVPSDKSE